MSLLFSVPCHLLELYKMSNNIRNSCLFPLEGFFWSTFGFEQCFFPFSSVWRVFTCSPFKHFFSTFLLLLSFGSLFPLVKEGRTELPSINCWCYNKHHRNISLPRLDMASTIQCLPVNDAEHCCNSHLISKQPSNDCSHWCSCTC